MTDSDTWAMIDAERTEFCDLVDSLNDEQWNTQSLCDGWKVKHVAAHLLGGSTIGWGDGFMMLLKNGFNFNKATLRTAQHDGDTRSRIDIAKALREHANDRSTPPFVKPLVSLNDNVVHQQDCRRPLGLARPIPEARLRAVLDEAAKTQPVLGNKKRIAGVKLHAADIDWTHGDGPEARGTGEALLMAMSGRKAALDDLTGDGVAILRSR